MNTTVFQLRTDRPQMCLVMLLGYILFFPPVTITLIYKLDLDILKMYLKFLGQGFQKL